MPIAKRTIPLLIAAFSLSLTAYAQTTATTERPAGGVSRDLQKEFKDLDRDGDGFLSRAEVEQNSSLKAKFEAADTNGDGKLDLSEFQVLEAEASPDRSLGRAPAEPPALFILRSKSGRRCASLRPAARHRRRLFPSRLSGPSPAL
jgi:hypothetical protein